MQCALCASPIAGDPDAMALICKNGHQDVVHDKCYKNRYSNEVYKKAQHGESTKYGRGPAKERCLHDGCSSFVKMKALGKMEEANGGGAAKEAKPNGAKNGKKAPQRRPPQEEGEWVDDEPKCQAFKADGTRCGRALAKDGKELLACRLHVDMLRKQKEFAENAAVEAAERERQAELELQAARERTDEILPELDKEALGLGQRGAIEIGDAPARSGPDEAEKAAARERAAARAARERAAAAPAKPAKWAAAEEGRNAKKGWRARASSCGWRHGEGRGRGGLPGESAPRERAPREREPRWARGCSTCRLLAAGALGAVGEPLSLRRAQERGRGQDGPRGLSHLPRGACRRADDPVQAHLLRGLPRPVDVPKVVVRLDAARGELGHHLPHVPPGRVGDRRGEADGGVGGVGPRRPGGRGRRRRGPRRRLDRARQPKTSGGDGPGSRAKRGADSAGAHRAAADPPAAPAKKSAPSPHRHAASSDRLPARSDRHAEPAKTGERVLTGRPSLRRDGAGISRRQEPRAVAQEQQGPAARHSSHAKSCGERRESVGPT